MPGAEHLEPVIRRVACVRVVQVEGEPVLGGQFVEPKDVADRCPRVEVLLVGLWQRVRVPAQHLPGTVLPDPLDQVVVEVVAPAGDGLGPPRPAGYGLRGIRPPSGLSPWPPFPQPPAGPATAAGCPAARRSATACGP